MGTVIVILLSVLVLITVSVYALLIVVNLHRRAHGQNYIAYWRPEKKFPPEGYTATYVQPSVMPDGTRVFDLGILDLKNGPEFSYLPKASEPEADSK